MFCIVVRWMLKRRMLKYPTIIVDWSISPSSPISFHFLYFSACCVLHAHLGLLYLLEKLTLFIIIKCPSLFLIILSVLSCLYNFLSSEVHFYEINRVTPAFLWLIFAYCIFFHSFNSICIYYYIWSEFLTDDIEFGHVFKSTLQSSVFNWII